MEADRSTDAPDALSREQRQSLETLHALCLGCADTLYSASEMIEDPSFRTRLRKDARAWGTSAAELGALSPDRSEPSQDWERMIASLRRTRIVVQSAVGDTGAIVAECDERTAEARQRLEAAARTSWPTDIRGLLDRILKRIAPLPDQK